MKLTLITLLIYLILSGCTEIIPGSEKGKWNNQVNDIDEYMELWFDGNGKAIVFYSTDFAFARFKEYEMTNDSILLFEIPENGGGRSILPISTKLVELTNSKFTVLVEDKQWNYSKFSTEIPQDFSFGKSNKKAFEYEVNMRIDSVIKELKK